ncbi:L-2-hydroxyglutarate oxidase [Aeromicrobium sp. YIM 150415]|uniref:L-2-hydroxyglutarate oxidase n=1 Tax=Aeromicrobium sp. YIM 150415 TaxID=2803912 RepID=UPI0019662F10|nr:L-2-hydroxyglutarate oxidase [Aeromicrobium sp. YIM 150415]MBM9461939.1 L-2-hydroxyglutarate oxidase [Aeromicrobium sp. YIM 150415]
MQKAIVVGAGIVGLATAAELCRRGYEAVVLEKETSIARHQTGRNSGVIHSGLYYVPGSRKATMCKVGATSMLEFAREHGVAHRVTGKLVVATGPEELPQLEVLAQRSVQNGVPVRRITADEAREYEPHVACLEALRVETTGIIDYPGVCEALAGEIRRFGGEIRFGQHFVAARSEAGGVAVETATDTWRADVLINCAGLYSDRVAAASGVEPSVRIVPFRGEYYELTEQASRLVNGLIYPVPDPRFPFLGVHLTAMIDGSVHAGPNAVLALSREGYTWSAVKPRELANALAWPGLWRLGAKHARPGLREIARSLSTRQFAGSLARLVPEITVDDIVRSAAGVRAQALNRDGSLVDDFAIEVAPSQVHVLNAPSPAATASLEIAKRISDIVQEAAR